MASSDKLPSGKWRCRVFTGKNANGNNTFETFIADTKKEAELLAAQFTIERKHKEKVKLTLGEAMDEFIKTCKAQDYSPSTIAEYSSRRKSSFSSLEHIRIDSITERDVQLLLDARAEKHTPKTVKNDFYFLKRVLNKYVPSLSLDGITISKKKSRRKFEFSETWAFDILQYIQPMQADFQIYTFLTLSAGLRPSESYALTWADISAEPITALDKNGKTYQTGEIRVNAASVRNESSEYIKKGTKTASGERVLHPDWALFDAIYSLKPRGADDQRILDMTPNMIPHWWDKVREALSLPKEMRFYDLRHYYATAYANSGASEEELQKAMGHSTSAFTHKVYVELFREKEAAVNANMAEQTEALYNRLKGQK